MDAKDALKWTAIYRAVSWTVGLVGLAIALGPLYFWGPNDLGVGLAIGKLVKQPLLAIPMLVGFLLWQTAKTATYYKTVSQAVQEELEGQFDPEIIKSDILSVLDDRLSDMQTEVQRTRNTVEDLDTGSSSSGEASTTGFDFQE